ncbi:flagellar motor switch protein FliN [bacterium]|nr:flagellar motor switch protein FliN [bacterium]
MLMDLELPVTVELGRIKMMVKDILDLGPGALIELNKFSGEPVDVYVNEKKFAEGEVVVIEQNFGVRITALIGPDERLMNLK